MNTPRHFPSTLLVVLTSVASAAVMTACGPESGDPVSSPQASTQSTPSTRAVRPVADREAPPVVRHLGRVTGVEAITEASRPTGAGAVIGGVAGGVVGHQIGDGNGQKAATVLGAVGGALAGNQIEKRRAEKVVGYRVSVHMDDGDSRSVRVDSRDGLEVGDRVRVEGNHLIRL